MIQESHGDPLPPGLTREMIDHISLLVVRILQGDVGTKEQRQLYLGPMVTELVSNMDVALGNGTRPPNTEERPEDTRTGRVYYEYFTRLLMIPALMSMMNMNNLLLAPYGAAFFFELHKEELGEPYIKVCLVIRF